MIFSSVPAGSLTAYAEEITEETQETDIATDDGQAIDNGGEEQTLSDSYEGLSEVMTETGSEDESSVQSEEPTESDTEEIPVPDTEEQTVPEETEDLSDEAESELTEPADITETEEEIMAGASKVPVLARITMSDSSIVKNADEVTEGDTVTVKAYLNPLDVPDIDLSASYINSKGNAISAVAGGTYDDTEGAYPVEITFTGEEGVSVISVKEAVSGIEATCTVNVKKRETVYAPYLVNVQGTGREYGDIIGIRTQTPGAQIFYILDTNNKVEDDAVWDAVSWNEEAGRFMSSSDDIMEYKTALIVGKDTSVSGFMLHARAYKKDLGKSDVLDAQIEFPSVTLYKWNDVTPEDRLSEFDGDLTKLESADYQGIWIPKSQLTDKNLIYTGQPVTLKEPRVYFGNRLLKAKTDYTLQYSNNTNATTVTNMARVKVVLRGNYSGNKTLLFKIDKLRLSTDDVNSGNLTYTVQSLNAIPLGDSYRNQNPDLKIKVKAIGRTLKPGTDYKIEYDKGTPGPYVSLPGVYAVNITTADGNPNYEFPSGIRLLNAVYCLDKVNNIPISRVVVSKIPVQKMEDWKNKEYKVRPTDFTVTYKGVDLIEGLDGHYTVDYKNNTTTGTASLIIKGTGRKVNDLTFDGFKTVKFKISGIPLSKENVAVIGLDSEYSYTGEAIDPNCELKYNGTRLVVGTDYDVKYAGNKHTNAGKVSMTFKFKGKYAGSLKKSFRILPTDMSAAAITMTYENGGTWDETKAKYPYVKGGVKPGFGFRKGSSQINGLIPGKDYTVTYANNKAAGEYNAEKKGKRVGPSVTVKFTGNYKGTVKKYFTIDRESISSGQMKLKDLVANASPNKYEQTVVVTDKNGKTLKAGVDYDKKLEYTYDEDVRVTYKVGKGSAARIVTADRAKGDKVQKADIIPAGTVIRVTATGIANYKYTVSATYSIAPNSLKSLKFYINPDRKYVYTGRAITPGKGDIRIQKKVGRKWVDVTAEEAAEYAEYYDITGYKNNVKKGANASVLLQGKNGYAGTATVTFKILKRPQPNDY